VRQRLSAPIAVHLLSSDTGRAEPRRLVWAGQSHHILRVGLHHQYRRGRTLYHVFSVATDTLFYRLVLNTDSLQWTVEEIADGLPD
jgi:hypothetical protein